MVSSKRKFNITNGIIISVIIHSLVLASYWFKLIDSRSEAPKPTTQVLTADLVPASLIDNLKSSSTGTKKNTPNRVRKELKTVAKPTTAKAKQQAQPPAPSKQISPSLKESLSAKSPEAKPTTPNTSLKAKESKQQKADTIDAILKNLDKEAVVGNKKQNALAEDAKKLVIAGEYDEKSPYTITYTNIMKKQIENYWHIPVNNIQLDSVVIVVKIILNQQGAITQAQLLQAHCPNISQDICALMTDSAIRAVHRASPIENLPVELYDHWRDITVYFRPTNITNH